MSENIGKQENREIVRSPFRADEEQPYIFISYSHKDRERVFPIIKRLYEQGWRIWYDEGLEIATNYLATLSQHIKNCAAFLLFVTENSVKSEFVCEKELIVASNYNKIIAQCVLDEAARFSGEAQDVLDIVTASRKHPRTDESGLEAALESIEGLTRGERRTAKGITITSGRPVADGDEKEYYWMPCEGGVRLTSYNGKDEEVHIPAEYPAASGQAVVEVGSIICIPNTTVRKVWIPKTAKRIVAKLFISPHHTTDVYIPSGVEEIVPFAFKHVNTESFRIHCAENSEAHRYALKHNFNVVLDEFLRVKDAYEAPYVYCSYAANAKTKSRVDEILEKLTAAGCEVRDVGSANGVQRIGALNQSRCFIAFISREYISDGYIEELMLASKAGKKLMMYVLEDCTLPPKLELAHPADQQLRYNELTEEERTAKVVGWLESNDCCKMVSVPDFVARKTRDGITLLKYIGGGGDVVIQREYSGIPVTAIGYGAFYGCRSMASIIIPDFVKAIGDWAFRDCSGLHSVTIPNSVTKIGDNAFQGCSGLNSVVIPDSVTKIGECAFYVCRSLTSIIIPDSVTEIGEGVFRVCPNLTVYCSKDSRAWAYCEENNIPHKELTETPEPSAEPAPAFKPVPAEPRAAETAPSESSVSESAAKPVAQSSEELAPAPAKAPARRSSAWWLVPAALALALGGAAAVQLTGLFDIFGAIGSLLG